MNWKFWKKTPPPVFMGTDGGVNAQVDIQSAYISGLMQGELKGRLALIREIEAQFSPNTTQEFDADAARTLRLKQLQ